MTQGITNFLSIRFKCMQVQLIGSMSFFISFIILLLTTIPKVDAQALLLESVKRNPEEAKAMCKKFKSMNAKKIKALSAASIKEIAKARNLSETDAEILSTYVIGLNCPDVR